MRLLDGDLATIKARAAREGLAVGAWVRELAVRTAGGAGWELATARHEVLAQLVRVRIEVAVILGADDVPTVGDRVVAVLCRLDTLIGDAVQVPPR